MSFTDDNLDILQNLEFTIVHLWRQHPEMTDYVAGRAYEAAFQLYRAEMRGHVPKPTQFTGLDALAFDALKAMCEIRLGRGESPIDGAETIPGIPVERLVDCLRELKKSVERHTAADGRQGYLKFIDGFLP